VASPTNEGVVPAAIGCGFNVSTKFRMQDASSPRASSTGGVTTNKAESASLSAGSSVFSFGSHLPMTICIQDLVSTRITAAQYPTRTPTLEESSSLDTDESIQGAQEAKYRLGEAVDEIDESMEPSIDVKIRSPNESTIIAPFAAENTTLPADFPDADTAIVVQLGSPAMSDGYNIPTQHAYLMDATDDKIAFDDPSGKQCYAVERSAVAKAIGTVATVSAETVTIKIQKEPELTGNRASSQQSYIDAPSGSSDPLNSTHELPFQSNNTSSRRRNCDSRSSTASTSESSYHIRRARLSAHLQHPYTTPLKESRQGEGSNTEQRKKTFHQAERCGGSPNDDSSLGFQSCKLNTGRELTDERLPKVTQLLLDGRMQSNGSAESGAGGQGGIECRADFVPDLDSRSERCTSEVQNEDVKLVDISQARRNELPTLLIGGIKRRTGRASKKTKLFYATAPPRRNGSTCCSFQFI
jgi:hypothetical protein